MWGWLLVKKSLEDDQQTLGAGGVRWSLEREFSV